MATKPTLSARRGPWASSAAAAGAGLTAMLRTRGNGELAGKQVLLPLNPRGGYGPWRLRRARSNPLSLQN